MTLRILIAEDSELFAQLLTELIEDEPDLELLSVVPDGEAAVRACQDLSPDLVLMDIQMPRLDGLQATERIMATHPTPILVVTSDPFRGGVDMTFRALRAGALDLVDKSRLFASGDDERAAFLSKMRLLAEIPVVRHVRGRERSTPRPPTSRTRDPVDVALVGVAASTGGPRALAHMLPLLPTSLPAALLIVQHITPGFTAHLARWLDEHSPFTVKPASHGERPKPGVAYLAPSGSHLRLSSTGSLSVSEGEPVRGHLPSADVLLASLAERASERSVGVILSGMGDDGARGLSALHSCGAHTMAQDRESAVVYGMPGAAIALGAVSRVVPLDELAETICAQVAHLTGATTS